MELLKSRRVWAGVAAIIALTLPLLGYNDLDANSLTDAIMGVVEAISSLAAVILPIWSYFYPKQ